ncbi:MAG: fused MFS/spermidine synthase [Candidatus Berkiella sp.]
MIAFSLSIFLSAFLLFIAQPLLAKKLLASFGGTPTVWLSIVLFFQSILLLGYLYAFILTKIKRLKLQVHIHVVLLITSVAFIPVIPIESKLFLQAWPPLGVFGILAATLCLPAMVIAASSPLLQYWYCQCYQTQYPYRYYALSNAGSLIGLLAFPFLLEPFFGLQFQLYGWSLLYIVYLCTAGVCLYIVYHQKTKQTKDAALNPPLKKSSMLFWVILTFLSCALLLSSTQIMLQDVAGFPLLWVVPLSLYLISFIITFSYPSLYVNYAWAALFIGICATLFYYFSHHALSLTNQIFLYCGLLFSGCMICHGELYQLKPDKTHLTTYYLLIALGGVLGGVFVNLIAPLIFNQWWEFYGSIFGILGCLGILITINYSNKPSQPVISTVWLISFISLGALLYLHLKNAHQDVMLSHRNFFGGFEVTERFANNHELHYRTLTNGSILHGKQFLFPEKRNNATTYYSQQSGVGLAIAYQREIKRNTALPGLSIGVIGLGSGTLAALTESQDTLRFYEIDPDVEKIARNYFYYLKDARATTHVIIGDGRLKLLEELKTKGSCQFDVLAIDAFNGDAIPVHLLTLQALEIYLEHLAPQGILAFHTSSRYVDLLAPLQALASKMHLYMFTTFNNEDLNNGIFNAQWVLMSKSGDIGPFLYLKQSLLFPEEKIIPVWTDDYNYLLSVIKW